MGVVEPEGTNAIPEAGAMTALYINASGEGCSG